MRTFIVGLLMLCGAVAVGQVPPAGHPPAPVDEPGAVVPPAVPTQPPAVPTQPPAGSAHAAGRTEYRFDAMRIDGTLHGPLTLEVRAMTGSRDTRLVRLRRSFLQRILETLEDRSLHRR